VVKKCLGPKDSLKIGRKGAGLAVNWDWDHAGILKSIRRTSKAKAAMDKVIGKGSQQNNFKNGE
jgi:hypothetical protein